MPVCALLKFPGWCIVSAKYRGGALRAARVRGSEKCRNILALNGHFT